MSAAAYAFSGSMHKQCRPNLAAAEAVEEVESEELALEEEGALEDEEAADEAGGDGDNVEAGEDTNADEEVEAQKSAAASKGNAGASVNTEVLEELRLDPAIVQVANDAWRLFINTAPFWEKVGEALYVALFESAPSLQSLFVTPRAVQAMKFMNGLVSFVTALEDPPKSNILVETFSLSFTTTTHIDVTVPRVVIFRDAILDLFSVELGGRVTSQTREGWKKLLNYVGGAIIYARANHAERINTLLTRWKICDVADSNDDTFKTLEASDDGSAAKVHVQEEKKQVQKKKGCFGGSKSDEVGAKEGAEATGTVKGGSEERSVMSAFSFRKLELKCSNSTQL